MKPLGLVLACSVTTVVAAAAQTTAWLDRPLQNWNTAGAAIPRSPAGTTDRQAEGERCKLPPLQTPAARAVAAAGWLPQAHLDRELVKGDVEVVAGFAALDGRCAPTAFHLFVFVGGQFAGTLSPQAMAPGTDASAGVVRFAEEGLTAEFARYKPGDSNCCPTSRMAVRYRIDRGLVVPLDARTTRSY
jgi:hypothetical protein